MDAATAVKELCSINGQQVNVIGQRVYVDGGNASFTSDHNMTSIVDQPAGSWTTNDFMFYFDLDVYITRMKNESSLPLHAIKKPDTVTNTIHGALYSLPDNKTLVEYGGLSSNSKIWTYNENGDKFAESSNTLAGAESGAWAQSATTGYYFSGLNSSDTSKQVAALQIIDLETQEGREEPATNIPSAIVGSALIWAPYGQEGILVSLGGKYVENSQSLAVPMNQIWVYDIYSGVWANQTATPSSSTDGIPDTRYGLCAVAAHDYDSKTTQVQFYGGSLTTNDNAVDEMWGLSLPDFTWFKYDAGLSDQGKVGASCTLVNDRFFTFVGGSRTINETFGVVCYTDPVGIAFWDMNDPMSAWSSYDPSLTGYSVPLSISTVIGTRREPAAGWSTPTLHDIFNNRTVSKTASSSVAEISATAVAKNSGNTGAIVGGILGGLAVVALIALGIFAWCRKTKRRSRRQILSEVSMQEGGPPEAGGWASDRKAGWHESGPAEVPGDTTAPSEMMDSSRDYPHELP